MNPFNASPTAGVTIEISYAELAGANSGQRPDLISRSQVTYRTPDGSLYAELNGQLVRSASLASYVLAQTGVPVILAPNGTVAANGVLTLVTPLGLVYGVTGAWVRLPAGAVVGGQAGLYYAVFASSTVGTIYTHFVDSATSLPTTLPSGPLVPVVGSGVAYTQTTGTDITLASYTLPGGLMGANGSIDLVGLWSAGPVASGGRKLATRIGAHSIKDNTYSTGSLGILERSHLFNRGAANRQVSWTIGYGVSYGNVAGGCNHYNVDTTKDNLISFIGNLAVATDYIVLEATNVQVLPA